MDVQLYNEDCFKMLSRIADNSIDLVLTDPPYGTTRNRWDCDIDLQKLYRLFYW